MTAAAQLPIQTKNVVLGNTDAKPGLSTWYETPMENRAITSVERGEVVLQVNAVGFNHRDKWIRQGLYPGIEAGKTMGSDCAGVVIADGDGSSDLIGKRFFANPSRGWLSNKKHSEEPFILLGGCPNADGVFATAVKVPKQYLIPTPSHLSDEQAAAWPLAAVTAWRATFVKAEVEKGDNVLITGIGGGVALQALQFAVAKGANVYVTSGSPDKLRRAIEDFGAKGGVIYKDEDWPKQLKNQLPAEHNWLDAVIDSAGGDIVAKVNPLLQPGSPIAIYGMTSVPKTTFTMADVLKNIELRGSTMGSLAELKEATEFISQHKVAPVVDQPVINGLENSEEGFQRLVKGSQMGNVVIKVAASKL